jgi:hypothetical protein
MAKTLVINETNPNIMIELKTDEFGVNYGEPCTQCGFEVPGNYHFEDAQQEAEIHIDRHDGEE